jgi:hypothetical protein
MTKAQCFPDSMCVDSSSKYSCIDLVFVSGNIKPKLSPVEAQDAPYYNTP